MQQQLNALPALTPVTVVIGPVKATTTASALVVALEGGIRSEGWVLAPEGTRYKMTLDNATLFVPKECLNYAGVVTGQVLHFYSRRLPNAGQAKISPGFNQSSGGIINARRWYYALKTLEYLGYTKENIVQAHNVDTNAVAYTSIQDIGFFYFIERNYPEFVNWRSLFMKNQDPWKYISEMFELPEMKNNPEDALDAMRFFQDLNLAQFANDGADAGKIRALEDQKLRANLVLDVYGFDPEYYTYPGPSTDPRVLDASKYSERPPLKAGTRTILPDMQSARKNMSDVLTTLFKKSPNPNFPDDFPWNKVVLAGGLIEWVLTNPSERIPASSDIDIFVVGEGESIVNTLNVLLQYFNVPRTPDGRKNRYISTKGGYSVFEVRIMGYQRPIQIILSTNSINAYDVISRFDLSNIRLCYYNGHFYGTPDSITTLRTRVATVQNSERIQIGRYAKTLFKGVSLLLENSLPDAQQDADLRNPASEFCVRIRRSMAGSVMKMEHDMSITPTEEDDRFTHQIAQLVNGSHVFTGIGDLDEAVRKAAASNFKDSYRLPPLGMDIVHAMTNTVKPNDNQVYPIRSVAGNQNKAMHVVWVTRVIECTESATGSSIHCENNQMMKEFVEKVLPPLWAKVGVNNAKPISPVADNGLVPITFTADQLRTNVMKGKKVKKPIIRDGIGNGIGVDPDALNRQEVTIVMSLAMRNEKGKYKIEFIPKTVLVPLRENEPVVEDTRRTEAPVQTSETVEVEYEDAF